MWMIHSLDKEARRLGVARQFVIKVWAAEAERKAAEPSAKATGLKARLKLGMKLKRATTAVGIPPCAGCGRRARVIDGE
jgi:hypothetical protein